MKDYFKQIKEANYEIFGINRWLEKRPRTTLAAAIEYDKQTINEQLNLPFADQEVIAAVFAHLAEEFETLNMDFRSYDDFVRSWMSDEEYKKMTSAWAASRYNGLLEENELDASQPMSIFRLEVQRKYESDDTGED